MKNKELHELKVKRLTSQISFIKEQLNSWKEKDKDKRECLKQTLECLESELDDVKAIKIIVDKHIDLSDVYGYDNYTDYRINYYEFNFDEQGFPYWYLEEDEFNVLKKVFSRKYY